MNPRGAKALLVLELLVVYGVIIIRDGFKPRSLIGATVLGALSLIVASFSPSSGLVLETIALVDLLFFGRGNNVVEEFGGWLTGGTAGGSAGSGGVTGPGQLAYIGGVLQGAPPGLVGGQTTANPIGQLAPGTVISDGRQIATSSGILVCTKATPCTFLPDGTVQGGTIIGQ